MTRTEREALLGRYLCVSAAELRKAIAEQLDRRRELKAQRARDLSGVIDALTVLVGIHQRREGKGFLHDGQLASLDPGGELWINDVCPVRARWSVEAGKAAEAKAEERREEEDRRKARDRRVLEAARRLADRGESLTGPAIMAEAGMHLLIDVQNAVANLRHHNLWGFGPLVPAYQQQHVKEAMSRTIARRRLGESASSIAAIDFAEPGEAASKPPRASDEASGVWVTLPGFPDYEGTVGGKIRRAATGRELVGDNGTYGSVVKEGGVKKTSVTRAKVARLACQALGLEPPEWATQRGRPRKAASTNQRA